MDSDVERQLLEMKMIRNQAEMQKQMRLLKDPSERNKPVNENILVNKSILKLIRGKKKAAAKKDPFQSHKKRPFMESNYQEKSATPAKPNTLGFC